MWTRQLIFSDVTFLSSGDVSVVFNVSSSHSNTNLLINRFSHGQFLVCKYSSILHALLRSQTHLLGFHKHPFSQELQSSNSLHSHWHLSRFHFCFQLHTLSFSPHLHSHESCWTRILISFIPDIKLDTFAFIFFTFFRTQTRACESSVVLQLPPP